MLHVTACPTPSAWFRAGACGGTPQDIRRSLMSFWEAFAVDIMTDLMSMCSYAWMRARLTCAYSPAASHWSYSKPPAIEIAEIERWRAIQPWRTLYDHVNTTRGPSRQDDWGKQQPAIPYLACTLEHHRVIHCHHRGLRSRLLSKSHDGQQKQADPIL